MVSSHVIHGLPVEVDNTRPDIETRQVLERLAAALELIRRYTPPRFRRLARDFDAIWVRRFPCRAAFFPDHRACLIELTFLAHPDITPAQVAASIVHEGVHARIRRMGIRHEGQEAKEERLCRRAEIELGRLVPGGEAVVSRATEALGLADAEVAPAIDWRLAAERVRDADRRG
jgi:hypothetical protein